MNTRTRGFALMDLMVTVALVATALSLAAVLLGRSMTLTNRAAEADAQVRGLEQMQTMLSRDVARGQALRVDANAVTIADVTWRTEPGRVTRKDDAGSRVFEVPEATVQFERAPYGVVLIVESNTLAPTRLPLINSAAWAKESLR